MAETSTVLTQLGQPLALGSGHTLRNRLIAIPAAGRAYVDPLGRPTNSMLDMYAERAAGGFALVYIHATIVDPDCTTPAELILADKSALSAFSELADAIRSNGALAGIQIISHWQNDFPYAMSELSVDEIEDMISRQVRGAELAAEAGFDVINLQASHGWPVQRFISGLTNDRTDQYGAPDYVASRITEAVKRAVGSRCAVSWRLSINEFAGPDGITPALIREKIIPVLAEEGCDLFDLSLGRSAVLPKVRDYLANETTYSSYDQALKNFEGFRGLCDVPISVRGRITSLEGIAEALKYGDVVGVGRQAIADPAFARKILGPSGERVRECIGCNYCLNRVVRLEMPARCAVNWSFGRPFIRTPVIPTAGGRPPRILVVGGGVAGLTAATALARYGAAPEVREARPEFGGQVLALRQLKQLNLQILYTVADRLVAEATSLNVELTPSTRADVDAEARKGSWDAIIVATGATLAAGLGLPVGVTASSMDELLSAPPSSVVLLGHGGEGAEWAVVLAAQGWRVSLVDTAASATTTAYDYDGRRAEALDELLDEHGVERHEGVALTFVESVGPGAVRIGFAVDGAEHSLSAARLALFGRQAVGAPARGVPGDTVEPAAIAGTTVIRIGDCVRPLGLAEAIDAGERAAIMLATAYS